ncbi:MAG: ATP-binding protein [Aestuariivirga sp.]|nr:ATP-binding protein [Aestuariivirga sp.]
MSAPFTLDQTLKIGTVFEVAGSSIKAALSPTLGELTRLHRGRIYGIGQIGSLLKIHFGRRVIFASIRTLRLQTDEEAAAVAALSSERRVLEADLLGEGVWDAATSHLDFSRGTTSGALPVQDIYLLTDDETKHVYGSIEDVREGKIEARVPIGMYVGPRQVECRADIDRMFSQHCAVLGSTGSGKSSAVAVIIRCVMEHKFDGKTPHPRIILIDPHGEYAKAFPDKAQILRAYDTIEAAEDSAKQLRLPYWLMSSDEFRSLVVGKTEFEATSQANTVYKALRHARLVFAGIIKPAAKDPSDTLDGNSPQDPIYLAGKSEKDVRDFDRDRPQPFSIVEFRRHIEWRQPYKALSKTKVPEGEFHKDYGSILDKLAVLCSDNRIKFLMHDHKADDPKLSDILSQFVGKVDDGRDLKIIDISGLPNEVAGPLTALISRLLFQYKLFQTQAERERDPILLVCEEAHRYVPNQGEAQYAAAQSAIRRIAREGRKYGLGLMLVSQRPSDVEATVLAQCNTWLVLRLSNSADQAHVTRMLPDGLSGMTSLLSSLPRQEALFVGEGAALPSRIRLKTLEKEQLPKSSDIPFGAGWISEPLLKEEIEKIAARMIGDWGKTGG